MGRFLQRESTVAILLGAHAWPKIPYLNGGASFSASHRDFRGYLLDEKGLHLRFEDMLDLFDSEEPVEAQLEHILDFIEARRKYNITDILIYYVGHGSFTENNNQFYLLARKSSLTNEASRLTISALSQSLIAAMPFSRKIVILDCCFSGAAARDMQASISDATARKAAEDLPDKGTILLCSSAHDSISMAPAGATHTMFTGALLEALKDGDKLLDFDLTLWDVLLLTRQKLKERWGKAAVHPVLHEPDQANGQLQRHSAFPNPAQYPGYGSKEGGAPLEEDAPAEESTPPESRLQVVKDNGHLIATTTAVCLVLSAGIYYLTTTHPKGPTPSPANQSITSLQRVGTATSSPPINMVAHLVGAKTITFTVAAQHQEPANSAPNSAKLDARKIGAVAQKTFVSADKASTAAKLDNSRYAPLVHSSVDAALEAEKAALEQSRTARAAAEEGKRASGQADAHISGYSDIFPSDTLSTEWKGQVVDGHPSGFGIATSKTSSGWFRFSGKLDGWTYDGPGVYEEQNGYKIEGTWRQGKTDGYFSVTATPNLAIMVSNGLVEDGYIHGPAVVHMKDGSKMLGTLGGIAGDKSKIVINGYGAMLDPSGKILQQGLFASGKLLKALSAQ